MCDVEALGDHFEDNHADAFNSVFALPALQGKSSISEDYAKSTGFCVNFTKKKKQMLDGGIAGAWDHRKYAKSSPSMFL